MNMSGNNVGKNTPIRMFSMAALLVVATAGPVVTASYAADPEPMKADTVFQALDQNKDGKLTAVEVKSNPELSQQWSAIDKDDNGEIDEAEFSAFEAMKKATE